MWIYYHFLHSVIHTWQLYDGSHGHSLISVFRRWTSFHGVQGGRKKDLPSTWETSTPLIEPVPQCSPIARVQIRSISEKGKKKRLAIRLTGIDDIDKCITSIAHQRLPSSLLFFPSFYFICSAIYALFGHPPSWMRGWGFSILWEGRVMG
jgi:hypothetical protein